MISITGEGRDPPAPPASDYSHWLPLHRPCGTKSGGNRADRAVRSLRIYEGTTEIQQLVVARQLLRS